MNVWFNGCIALLLLTLPCGWVVLRGPRLSDRLVGLQAAGSITALLLVLVAQGMERPSFFDLGLLLAVLSAPSSLVLAHTLERWFR